MRESVTNHLANNNTFYHDFLAQPIQSSDAYNADTEAPSDEDAIIDSAHDAEQQGGNRTYTDSLMVPGVTIWQYKAFLQSMY